MEPLSPSRDADRESPWECVDDALTRRDTAANALADSIRSHLAYADETPPHPDVSFAQLMQRLRGSTRGAVTVAKARHPRTLFPRTLAISAVCAGLIGLVVLSRAKSPTPSGATRTHATRTYVTSPGQIATVELADGSRVTLAPRSRMTVTGTNSTDRIIDLSGEARFDVIARPSAPFFVHTGDRTGDRANDVVIRVLGTAFEVRRYPGELGRIAVLSGKVSAGTSDHAITLVGGMTATFRDSIVTAMNGIDSSAYADWARGRLMFRDAPVPVVLATLERWYGYRFRLADSALATANVTTAFTIGKPSEMLTLLRRVLDAELTVQDSLVTLRVSHGVRSPRTPNRRNAGDLLLPSLISTEAGR